MEANPVTFLSAGGGMLDGLWYLPARRATNGAAIILPGFQDRTAAALCEGAAQLGLSALHFNSRAAPPGQDFSRPAFEDLLGAFHFFQSFGKEMKPQRYYLLARGSAGLTALLLAATTAYAAVIRGVAVIDLPVADGFGWTDFEKLAALQAPVLLIQTGTAGVEPARRFSDGLKVAGRVVQIHGSAGNNPANNSGSIATNHLLGVDAALEWLEQLDADRIDLRN